MKKAISMITVLVLSITFIMQSTVLAIDNSEAAEFERHNNVDITLDGAFIQPYLYVNYSSEDWDKELSALKSVGVKEIIMGDTVTINKNGKWQFYYQSNLPEFKNATFYYESIKNLLENCKKHDIKVYLGMGFVSSWWSREFKNDEDYVWFESAIEENKRVIEDIYSIYKKDYPDTFAGFYFIYEIWNYKIWNEDALREKHASAISAGFNELIEKIESLDKNMGIYFSPFATRDGFATKENLTKFYTSFFQKTNFREIDAMLPMDNCGGGGQNIKTLEEWTKAYYDAFQASKTKLNFYSNNETFVQDNSDPLGANPTWGTATIDRYIEQIRITDKYSKKNFSFAYSHYFSPLNGVGGFHETYLDYMKTGILETEKPIAPTKVKTFYSNGTLSLSWSGIYDNKGISRINIYKDGSFIDFVPIIYDNQNFTNQTPPVKFVDKNFDRTKTTIYEIEAVDCAGNKSATKSKVVVTPEKLSNKVVLDKKYTDIWDVNDPLGNNRPVMVGDVDENGVINSLDALCILKSIVNMQTLSPSQLSAADVDGKNNISTLDSLLILKTIINFETGITK